MFQEEREKDAANFGEHLDAEHREMQKAHLSQKQVLNEIFESWGEIFGTVQKSKSNSENENKNL